MEIFHVLNRGVDKRKIFMNEEDHLRFIHDLFEFNDQQPINNLIYRFRKNPKDFASLYIVNDHKRKLLVKIHLFSLMPNHYHLLISPQVERGVTKFMAKLNIGYAKYFNEKYERKGALFEGRYKSILVENDSHFIHLPYYIHLNPLDLVAPEWRRGELKNYKKAIAFLNSYRWSSHIDYMGKKNFPSVTQREFLSDFFNGAKQYKISIENWLKDLNHENIKSLGKSILE